MIIGYRPGSSLCSLYHYSASYIMLFCPLWMYIVNRHFIWFEYLYSWLSYNPSKWCIVLNFIFKQTTMEQICLASKLFNFPSLLAQVLQRLTVFAQWIQITGNILRGYMMTSSNGSIFRITALCAGNSTMADSPHKGQWGGALMFSLISAWINGWVNIRQAGDLRCHRAHYDVIAMKHPLPVHYIAQNLHIVLFCSPHIFGLVIPN